MVNHLPNALLCSIVFVAVGTIDGIETEKNDGLKPLPTEISKAWSDAGTEVGWMNDLAPQLGVYRFWETWSEKADAGAIPAFRFPNKRADGLLVKLPDPGTAFGLDFHCGYYAGVSLKELAKLRNLQSLSIGAAAQGTAYADLKDLAGMTNLRGLYLFYLDVTDEQAKHLAGLKNLRVLDLSHTPITDSGLKELAGLDQLRWLNLRSTETTPVGVGALQKKLPGCKMLISKR